MQSRKTNTANAIILLVLIVCYLIPIDIEQVAVHKYAPIWTIFTHQLFHANILHLAGNLYVLLMVRANIKTLIAAYIVSVFTSLLIIEPTVGISGMLYAMLAIIFYKRNVSKKTCLLFAAMNIPMLFIPNIAAMYHITSFAAGYGVGVISKKIDEYRRFMS